MLVSIFYFSYMKKFSHLRCFSKNLLARFLSPVAELMFENEYIEVKASIRLFLPSAGRGV